MKKIVAILSLLSVSSTVFGANEPALKTIVECKQDRYSAPGTLKRTLKIQEFMDRNENKIKLQAVTEGFPPFVLDKYEMVVEAIRSNEYMAPMVSSGENFSLEFHFDRSQKRSALHIATAEGVTNEIMLCYGSHRLAAYFPTVNPPVLSKSIDLKDAYVVDPNTAIFLAVDKAGPRNEIQFIVNGLPFSMSNSGEMGPAKRFVNNLNSILASARMHGNLVVFFMKGPNQGEILETRFPIGTDPAIVLAAEKPLYTP